MFLISSSSLHLFLKCVHEHCPWSLPPSFFQKVVCARSRYFSRMLCGARVLYLEVILFLGRSLGVSFKYSSPDSLLQTLFFRWLLLLLRLLLPRCLAQVVVLTISILCFFSQTSSPESESLFHGWSTRERCGLSVYLRRRVDVCSMMESERPKE